MEINKSLFEEKCDYKIYHTLLNLFQYSIKDIDSYDELTEEEKEVISEELFNRITSCVIDYDDIYDVNAYLYTNGIIIVRIEQLFCSKKEIVDIFERTSEILCDICEIDIPIY